MALLADISLRRGIALLLIVIAALTAGTWVTIKWTTDSLIADDARENARDWANFLVANVADLKQIAAGEIPSAASMTFLEGTRKSSQVFRYVIFSRQGYSQFVADRDKIASVDLSEYSADAAEAVARKHAIINTSEGNGTDLPRFFAHAYVPVMVDNEPIGAVAAFVDETAQRARFQQKFLLAAVALCGLTALSFGFPAIAWYRRTREKQRSDRRIRYLAHHDALTGLANRGRLTEKLAAMFAVLPSTGTSIALHFIDLDRFKEVNDTLGHDGGDFLLSTIGQRLTSLTRMDDLVARLGGDEFVVVQTGVVDRQQAEDFAKRIGSIISAPLVFKEQEIVPAITIGVALAPQDGTTPERLLKSADLALYNGKAAGRNCIRFFAPEMDEAMRARLKLEKIVRDAVAHNKFELAYQPVYEIGGKHLVGFEALARLNDSEGNAIPPVTFIPVIEDLRLIDKFGAWILRDACRTAATWPNNLTVAVNLSPAQFETGNIVDTVASALKDSGLAPHRLELEITENLLLNNSPTTMALLEKLKAMGAAIVMDDFGTGYSSLSYLWKFPFDKIKIDRSFMEGFEKSGRDVETVVKTIIALGRELRMRVTVEGVETANQVDFLYDADADQVQGFFFGRPVPAAQVSADILADFRQSSVPASGQTQTAERKVAAAAANGR